MAKKVTIKAHHLTYGLVSFLGLVVVLWLFFRWCSFGFRCGMGGRENFDGCSGPTEFQVCKPLWERESYGTPYEYYPTQYVPQKECCPNPKGPAPPCPMSECLLQDECFDNYPEKSYDGAAVRNVSDEFQVCMERCTKRCQMFEKGQMNGCQGRCDSWCRS